MTIPYVIDNDRFKMMDILNALCGVQGALAGRC